MPLGEAKWREYGFKGKPGDLNKMPPVVSPYHYKLDWQMWFAAMGPYYQHPWILNLVAKLLKNNRGIPALIGFNHFREAPPKYIRALLYHYTFTKIGGGSWWERTYIEEYLPPLSLDNPQFQSALQQMG